MLTQTNVFSDFAFIAFTISTTTVNDTTSTTCVDASLFSPQAPVPSTFFYTYTTSVDWLGDAAFRGSAFSIGYEQFMTYFESSLGINTNTLNCSGILAGDGGMRIGVTALTSTSVVYIDSEPSSLTNVAGPQHPSTPPVVPGLPAPTGLSANSASAGNIAAPPTVAPTKTTPTVLQNIPTTNAPQASTTVLGTGATSITVTLYSIPSGFILNTQALISSGGMATLSDGIVVSLGASGIQIVSGQTGNLADDATNQPKSEIHIGSQTLIPFDTLFISGTTFFLAPGNSGVVVNGKTLVPGKALAASGAVYSLAQDGSVIEASSAALSLDPAVVPSITATSLAPEIFAVLIAGQTLTSEQNIVISGTIYSLGSSGSVIEVGSLISTPGIKTVTSGETYSVAQSRLAVEVGGQMLNPGGNVVISGTMSSIASAGLIAKASSSTMTVPIAEATKSKGAAKASSQFSPGTSVRGVGVVTLAYGIWIAGWFIS